MDRSLLYALSLSAHAWEGGGEYFRLYISYIVHIIQYFTVYELHNICRNNNIATILPTADPNKRPQYCDLDPISFSNRHIIRIYKVDMAVCHSIISTCSRWLRTGTSRLSYDLNFLAASHRFCRFHSVLSHYG